MVYGTHLEGNSPSLLTPVLFNTGYLSAKYLLMKVLAKDKITGPRKKARTPRTANPGTITPANKKQKPLTTRENAPKVRKLRGKDKAARIGLMELLIKPMTTPAIIAAGKLAIFTPGTTKSTINKLKAVAMTVKSVPHIVFT
jgi:hypothetical protein